MFTKLIDLIIGTIFIDIIYDLQLNWAL